MISAGAGPSCSHIRLSVLLIFLILALQRAQSQSASPQHKSLITDPLPWARLLLLVLIALGMLASGCLVSNRQDF